MFEDIAVSENHPVTILLTEADAQIDRANDYAIEMDRKRRKESRSQAAKYLRVARACDRREARLQWMTQRQIRIFGP